MIIRTNVAPKPATTARVAEKKEPEVIKPVVEEKDEIVVNKKKTNNKNNTKTSWFDEDLDD